MNRCYPLSIALVGLVTLLFGCGEEGQTLISGMSPESPPENGGASDPDLNPTLDWRTVGAVTPVKDQGQCGSVWAFAVTDALDGAYFLKYGVLPNFSEQELVDCSTSYGNDGCDGGLLTYAFNYVKDHGLAESDCYPYTARDGTCRASSCTQRLPKPSGIQKVTKESDLVAAVSQGPVAVAIHAGSMGFQFYYGGIFDDATCSHDVDHAMLLVGYGSVDGKDYWILKNSWGRNWGIGGYMFLARNKNRCGIGERYDSIRPIY